MTPSRRMLSLLAVPAVALSACGGGKSDKDKLTDIIKEGGKTPSSVCDHVTDALLKQLGGKDACVKASKSQPGDDSTKIKSLKIDGEKATASVSDKSGANTIKFVKEGGDWKVTQ